MEKEEKINLEHNIRNSIVCIEGIKKEVVTLLNRIIGLIYEIDRYLDKIEESFSGYIKWEKSRMLDIDIARLREKIKIHEGCRLFPYKDTEGHLTIGYGHNLEEGISQRTAEFMLVEDVNNAIKDFELRIPDEVKNNLTPVGKEVLIEMVFQMGINKVLGFKKTLEAIKNRRPEIVYKEMLDSRWAKQCPDRAKELAEVMIKRGIKI